MPSKDALRGFFVKFDNFLMTLLGLCDARAIDLDYKILTQRMELLTLASSLVFATATTALFSSPMARPTSEEMLELMNAFAGCREMYVEADLDLQHRSLWMVEEAERTLDVAAGNSSAPILTDDDGYFTGKYLELGGFIFNAMLHFQNAVIFSVMTYVSLVLVRKNEKRRFAFNVFYFFHLGAILASVLSITYGSRLLGTFIQTRIMFTYRTKLTIFEILRYNDIWARQSFPDSSGSPSTPYDHGNTGKAEYLIGYILSVPLLVNICEAFLRFNRCPSFLDMDDEDDDDFTGTRAVSPKDQALAA